MAELALAYSPPPCPALDAILAHDEHSLPCTDDQPMPDVRAQEGPLGYSRDTIRRHLRPLRDRVAVDSDLFVYYVGRDRRGQPVRASVAPDVFVVFGVPDREDRRSYVLWREPDADIRFVLEIASESTRLRDHTAKRDVYASLGVREYFLFDPPGGGRPAALLGLYLRDGTYREIAPVELPDGRPGIPSAVTDLVAHIEDSRLRWFDPVAGVDLLTYDESMDRGEAAERAREVTARTLEAEARARQRAEARVAELEARLRASDRT
ncbi:MAG: Uma2 family endonuclease [Gammaproteobacteria bacterium]|nr:Uma2 family endonuclease [Gammaproteobacteria bacterium]